MVAEPAGAVLVVEDEDSVRKLAVLVLSKHGFTVAEAATAEEALEHAAPVALLLTDVQLPGLDGLALAERLRQRHPGLKVVVMTGCCEDIDRRDTPSAADWAFLSKPFSVATLVQTVGRMLGTN